MSVIQIPQELMELRASLGQFLDREVRRTEEAYRQDIVDGRFDFVKEERRKLRKRSADLGFWTVHMPEEVRGVRPTDRPERNSTSRG